MARRRSAPKDTLERTIQFYRVDAGQDEAGQPNPFDHAAFLDQVDKLTWTPGDNSRYMLNDNESEICAHIDGPDCLRLGRVRRGGLPLVEDAGAVTPLTISPQQGLLEAIHVVWFDDRIVGADYNHYGPRLSRLGHYFAEKFNLGNALVRFRPLLKQDALDELGHLENLTLLRMKVRASYAEQLAQQNSSIGGMFSSALDAIGDAGAEIEIAIRPSPEGRQNALQRFMGEIRDIVRSDEYRTGVKTLKVTGRHDETHKLDVVDLLSDQLVSRKGILRADDRSRAISATSAYEAIREAYDELQPELEAAAEVIVDDPH